MEPTHHIWLNGRFRPWNQANIHILNNTLHHGFGAFEGMRFYRTSKGAAVFRLHDHIRRLLNSWHILGMPSPYDHDEIAQACLDTVKKNKLKKGYIRPIFYLDAPCDIFDPRNLKTSLAIAVWDWKDFLGKGALEKGIRVRVSSFTRNHINSMMTKAKITGSYFNSLLAKAFALNGGYDDTIMLTPDGLVGEGSGENLFIVRDGVLITPKRNGILEGITRDSLIRIAIDHGYDVLEENVTRDELYIADEVFFCGTAAEVTPITEIDNRAIGDGKPGPIARELQNAFFRIVRGKEPEYEEWLAYV